MNRPFGVEDCPNPGELYSYQSVFGALPGFNQLVELYLYGLDRQYSNGREPSNAESQAFTEFIDEKAEEISALSGDEFPKVSSSGVSFMVHTVGGEIRNKAFLADPSGASLK